VLAVAAALAVFLAFGWPVFVSTDPGDARFKVVATATLIAFLVSLAAVIVTKARR